MRNVQCHNYLSRLWIFNRLLDHECDSQNLEMLRSNLIPELFPSEITKLRTRKPALVTGSLVHVGSKIDFLIYETIARARQAESREAEDLY